MNIAEQLHARQAELRNKMAMGIAKGFETDIVRAEETDIEKAHKDGDLHPNGKWVWVSSANGGKGDWRTINGKTHKNHTAAAGVKSWDKADSFNKKGSDENKLWQSWYKFQTTGDPGWMGVFRDILAHKFTNVSSWTQTSPNTGKAIITAKDSAGKEVASIDLSGDTILLTKLQTFMDKCHAVKPAAQAKTNSANGTPSSDNKAVVKTPSKSKSKKQLLNDYKEYIDEQVSKRGNPFKENVAYIVYEYDKEPVEDENGDWVKDGNEFDPEHPYNFDVEEVEAFDTLAEAKKYLKKNGGNYYRGTGISCMVTIQEWDKRYDSWGDEEIDHTYSATEDGARLKLVKQLGLD